MKTKADLALDVLEQLADYYDVGHAKHLAVRCLDADGGLVGWHYNPARFALDLLGHVNQLDLANDEAGGAIPVFVGDIAAARVEVI